MVITIPSTPPADLTFSSKEICFYLNDTRQIVSTFHHGRGTLLDYIRMEAGLTGSKLGCSEGGCGACTVVIASWDSTNNRPIYRAVNACIVPLISVDGKQLITVEGIGSSNIPHMVQERIAKLNGSQCGFCTPGIVMSLYALVRNCQTEHRAPSNEEMLEALDGNLCRCTGYRPIIEAASSITAEMTKSLSTGCGKKDCCQLNGSKNGSCGGGNGAGAAGGCGGALKFDVKPLAPKEIIFPGFLRNYRHEFAAFGASKKWFRPTTKNELLSLKLLHPDIKLIGGSSEVQVEIKAKGIDFDQCAYVGDIPDLQHFHVVPGKGVRFGANITLSDLEASLEHIIESTDSAQSVQTYSAICNQLKYFAGRQIRNVATPAGNIVTASPISDLNCILMAAGALLTLESLNDGQRVIPLTEFFVGYRTTKLQPHEILTEIFVPQNQRHEVVWSFKQSKRKDDDIAIVTSGMRLRVGGPSSRIITSCTLAFGGVAPLTLCATKTQRALVGRKLDDPQTLATAIDSLLSDFNLPYSVPGGMASFRRALVVSFFYKFYNQCLRQLNLPHDAHALSEVKRRFLELSASSSDKDGEEKESIHLSAMKQVTGEATYIDDIPPFHKELFGVQVMSTKAHAKILSIDWTPILGVPGVMGYVDVNDLPNRDVNYWGPIPVGKELFFAEDTVEFVGQCIGVVVASDREAAAEAARRVKVEYADLASIISIEDAVSQNSFFGLEEATSRESSTTQANISASLYDDYDQPLSRFHGRFHPAGSRKVVKGDVIKSFENCKYHFSGTCRFGAQEHFYFETQCCVVVPEEDGELKIYASSQNPTETQLFAAQVTGVPASRVVCRVKRLGGGFGGKETRAVQLSSVAAVAAKKFKRPVRMVLSRSEDMLSSGQRHPFLVKWDVALDQNYRFTGLSARMYANAGWSMDLTRGVIDRAVLHIDNCYDFQNVCIEGYACKTNTASNTAFRGFGAPQGMFASESIIYDVADKLNIDVEQLREINYYNNYDSLTHYKQKIGEDFTVPEMSKVLKEEVDYDRLRKEVDGFNSQNKWLKRGLALVPTKFGVSFGALFLNQAGALIHIYEDGSVLLSHGGTEMGQGLHTKMATICAKELGVPLDQIFISETSTNTVANTSATAASASSDLNGAAVKDACDQLNERLRPYREKEGFDTPLSKLAHMAYMDRVNLSANGFYKTPEIGYEWGDFINPKPAFFYYTQGVAVAMVEVDTLTGDWTNLRTDIKMDIGRPINKNIDQGQIEGAFIQGQGLFTIEESLWLQNSGALFTRGPGAYKIPGFRDIPSRFRVSLLTDRPFAHLKTIHRSKGVGEPPLFLGSTVFFAIRDALKASLRQHGKDSTTLYGLPSPLTSERIRTKAGDPLASQAFVEPQGNEFFVRA